jgi:hypothetical protein
MNNEPDQEKRESVNKPYPVPRPRHSLDRSKEFEDNTVKQRAAAKDSENSISTDNISEEESEPEEYVVYRYDSGDAQSKTSGKKDFDSVDKDTVSDTEYMENLEGTATDTEDIAADTDTVSSKHDTDMKESSSDTTQKSKLNDSKQQKCKSYIPVPSPRRSERSRRKPKWFDAYHTSSLNIPDRPIDTRLNTMGILMNSGVFNQLNSDMTNKILEAVIK